MWRRSGWLTPQEDDWLRVVVMILDEASTPTARSPFLNLRLPLPCSWVAHNTQLPLPLHTQLPRRPATVATHLLPAVAVEWLFSRRRTKEDDAERRSFIVEQSIYTVWGIFATLATRGFANNGIRPPAISPPLDPDARVTIFKILWIVDSKIFS